MSIEIEDQKELIIHEIHSEMDRDYRDLKKFVRRNMNKHLLEEHPEDEDEGEGEDADDVANAEEAAEFEVKPDTVVTGTSVSAAGAAAAEAINEDMVIIMDDADFNSTDDEE